MTSFSTASVAVLLTPLISHSAGPRDHIRSAITNPDLALLLVILGLIAIYAEFSAPGRVLPGALGLASVILGLGGLVSHRVTWTGSALFLSSFLCYVLEARYQTRGVFTALGAVFMAIGSIKLIDERSAGAHVSAITAVTLAIPFAVLSSFLFSVARRAKNNKQFTRNR